MSRFEQFSRPENRTHKKKAPRATSAQGAGDALEALLTLSTLGMLRPPPTGKRKKEK